MVLFVEPKAPTKTLQIKRPKLAVDKNPKIVPLVSFCLRETSILTIERQQYPVYKQSVSDNQPKGRLHTPI